MKNSRIYSLLKTGKELYETEPEKLNHYLSEYTCIARYCKYELGMKNKEIENVLLSKNIGPMQEQKELIIEKAIKFAKKYGSLDSKSTVIISPHEVECLKKIKEYKHRKLFFALLVIAKWESNGYYNGNKVRANGLSKSRMNKEELRNAGNTINSTFENISFIGRNGFVWNFNNLPKLDTSYNEIIVNLDNPMGDFPEFCMGCENIYSPKNRRQKYCDKCKVEKDKEKKRKWWNKNYKK